jgi:hypothetical protein
MTHSRTHYRLANLDRRLNERVLSNPDEFLGPNWKEVLNFWLYLDNLSDVQLNIAKDRYWALCMVDKVSLRDLAWNASQANIGFYRTSRVASVSPNYASGIATLELIGSHKILEQGKSLSVAQLFLNL